MMSFVKRLMRFYWLHSQAYALITLPINGLGALSSFIVLFTLISGVKFPGWIYLFLFSVSTIVLFSLGLAAKKVGILAYWQSLNNSQNNELLSILRSVAPREKGGIIYPKTDETIAMEDMFERNDQRGEDTEIGKVESNEQV